MSALIFMDTETTGLSLSDDIWEFAAVRRDEDGTETELHLFIDHDRRKCADLPESFREDHNSRYRDKVAVTRAQACAKIQQLFGSDGPRPHVVGAVPNFDTERVALMFEDQGYAQPRWHYHLIDVENLVVGYLQGTKHALLTVGAVEDEQITRTLTLPWDSNELSLAVGVDPKKFERHTAMGDVRWAMAIYDAVMQ